MKKRIDQLLVAKGLYPCLSLAQAAIMSGNVLADGQKVDKPGTAISTDAEIIILGNSCPFVGRGGLKLESALTSFEINVAGEIALDVGISTGGFTDCLLQHGASRVYGIDVGYGQVDWKIASDSRVLVIERCNARNLTRESFAKLVAKQAKQKPEHQQDLSIEGKQPINFFVMDLSFISIGKVIPAILPLLMPDWRGLVLIKPQFEAKREEVGKGGIIRDKQTQMAIVQRVTTTLTTTGIQVIDILPSSVTGADGNQEYFAYLRADQ